MANGHDESNASVSPCADESSLSFKVDSKIVALVKNLADQLKDANFTPLNPDYLSSGFDELQIKYKQLDSILNETVSKTRSSSSDFGEDCLELISAGQGQENFFKAVLNCDTALTCGIILGIDQLWCYRCKTCALTQYMCLCVACFKGGNHQGHDFYASKLGNRGTCDCGNSSVIKPSGFCWQHRIKPSGQLAIPPKYIMSVAEFLVPKMFHRLLEDFVLLTDYNSNEEFSSIKSSISALTELSELGALSHALLTKILISPTIYKSFKRNSKAEEDCPELGSLLNHQNCLDELTFWLIYYKFPDGLMVFLLNLLPDETYKLEFFRCYVRHYSRLAPTHADYKAATVSIELLSNESLTSLMMQDHKFHIIILASIQSLISTFLIHSEVHVANSNEHHVVDISKIKNQCFELMVKDLNSLVDHPALAIQVMRDPVAIDIWLSLVSQFQGVLLNVRLLNQHNEFDSSSYYMSFFTERTLSYIMWSFALAVDNDQLHDCLLLVLKKVERKLEEWFEEIQFTPLSCWQPPPLQISFHLPLHRHLTVFAIQARCRSIEWPIPKEYLMRQLLMHPLMIQVVRAEISASMWVRNGLSIGEQRVCYAKAHFAPSCIDLDTHLIQMCANHVKSNWFVIMLLERFHMADWLNFSLKKSGKGPLEDECVMPLLQGALLLLCTTIIQRINIDMSEKEISKLELSTLLCMGDPTSLTASDRTHSQLTENIPDRKFTSAASLGNNIEYFEEQLIQLADYCSPQLNAVGKMSQGTYSPKDKTWINEFDPLFCLHRCTASRVYQQCLDRYMSFVRKSGFRSSDLRKLWPPFRVPNFSQDTFPGLRNILQTRELHSFLWIVLYRWWKEPAKVSELATQLSIHLLELAVSHAHADHTKSEVVHPSPSGTAFDSYLSSWFSHDSILCNMSKNIDNIVSFSSNLHNQRTELPELARLQIWPSDETIVSKEQPEIDKTLGDCSMEQSNCSKMEQPILENLSEKHTLVIGPESSSITKMLLSLHDRAASSLGSAPLYKPPSLPYTPPESRIGTACLFIGNVLNMAYSKDKQCQLIIDMWCKNRDERLDADAIGQNLVISNKPLPSNEDRRNAARERQKKLMEQLNLKRKEVLETICRESEGEQMKESEESLQCSICAVSSPINVFKNERRFIGMVVLYQTSAVLGYCRSSDPPELLNIKDPQCGTSDLTCRKYFRDYAFDLSSTFSKSSCTRAVNNVGAGCISVKSCGHYIHSDCHQIYMQSIQRSHADEFSCPVCRRKCNAVMPILPSRNSKLTDYGGEPVDALLNVDLDVVFAADNFPNWFKDCIEFFCDQLLDKGNCIKVFVDENDQAYNKAMILDSVLRCKLELDALQQKPSSTSMHLFLQHLLSIISVGHGFKEDRWMNQIVLRESWNQLKQINLMVDDKNTSDPLLLRNPVSLISQFTQYLKSWAGPSNALASVPLLLQDPIALLLQLTQYLNFCMAPTYVYELAERKVSELVVLQTFIRVRFAWLDKSATESAFSMCQGLMNVLNSGHEKQTEEQNNTTVKQLSDEFNAYTGLIKQWRHMIGCPNALNGSDEAMSLMNLACSDNVRVQAKTCVKKLFDIFPHLPQESLSAWDEKISTKIWCLPQLGWTPPRFLRLPRQFEDIMNKYGTRLCSKCNTISNESLLCLVCGHLVCNSSSCKYYENGSGLDYHGYACGMGSTVYLSVNSSLVHVQHEKRTGIWGCIYLDAYGEEDRGFWRGRPLILNDQRLSLLETQWISGSFDATIKKWYSNDTEINDN